MCTYDLIGKKGVNNKKKKIGVGKSTASLSSYHISSLIYKHTHIYKCVK